MGLGDPEAGARHSSLWILAMSLNDSVNKWGKSKMKFVQAQHLVGADDSIHVRNRCMSRYISKYTYDLYAYLLSCTYVYWHITYSYV
jgi:hypothetical protein